MKSKQTMTKRVAILGLLLMLGTGMTACSTSWKEEVRLHDGNKILVERSVSRGGRHEIGQKPPFEWQQLKFTMPVTGENVTWEDRYDEDIGTASFLPMLLDVQQGVGYLIAGTMGCLSYNKWGRPNPPYVVFKYEDKEWKRISLQQLPVEIKAPNLIFSSPDETAKRIRERPVSAKAIEEIIGSYPQPEYRTILREPVKNGSGVTSCEELVHYKCGWGAPGEFNRRYFERACN